MYLVDTSVLIDVARPAEDWFEWSSSALTRALDRGPVFINPIIYAELSVAYAGPAEIDAELHGLGVKRATLPYEAGFLAGKAYQRYRRRGGTRTSPLPDFYIGAHAAVRKLTLITRDARRVRDSFPSLALLTPD